MYYKKQGNETPIVSSGHVYDQMYSYEGFLYFSYPTGNSPSEGLIEITEAEFLENNPETVEPEPQPSQLDRIEESLKTSFSEAQQTAIDKYTEEHLEGGIL